MPVDDDDDDWDTSPDVDSLFKSHYSGTGAAAVSNPFLENAAAAVPPAAHAAAKGAVPSRGMPAKRINSFGGGGDKCYACGKTVYAAELRTVKDRKFHKDCFRCTKEGCSKLLQNDFCIEASTGNAFCKPHFMQLARPAQGSVASTRTASAPSVAPPISATPTTSVPLPAATAAAATATTATERFAGVLHAPSTKKAAEQHVEAPLQAQKSAPAPAPAVSTAPVPAAPVPIPVVSTPVPTRGPAPVPAPAPAPVPPASSVPVPKLDIPKPASTAAAPASLPRATNTEAVPVARTTAPLQKPKPAWRRPTSGDTLSDRSARAGTSAATDAPSSKSSHAVDEAQRAALLEHMRKHGLGVADVLRLCAGMVEDTERI